MGKIWGQSLGSILILTSSALLVGCGGKIPESRKVHQSPTSDKETGVVVSGLVKSETGFFASNVCESKVASLLNKNPNLTVRVVNPAHCLNEFYGASESEIKALIDDPEVIVEKNKFVKMKFLKAENEDNTPNPLTAAKKHPIVEAIEQNQQVKLEGDLLEYANSCKLSRTLAPKINVSNNQGRDKQDAGTFFEIGQTLELNAEKSLPRGNAKQLQFLWILTSPEHSALDPKVLHADRLSFAPDSTGLHIYSVIAKDENGYCDLDLQAFYVTANYAFRPENPMPDSYSERIDANTFWHVFHIGAQQAWKTAVGAGMIVGVIDSGVDYNHPALSSNIFVNASEIAGNGIDDDNNGFVDDVAGYDFGQDDASPFDDFGHGTHVAGIAASNVFGAAKKARILPTKFGSGMGFDIASVTGAIKYSVDSGAKVLNMSFGWEDDLAVMKEAMDYAESHDVLVVAASGNDTLNNDTKPSYPCNYKHKNLISIAATDENDKLTFYSNFGNTVHLGAPGGTPEKPIISSYKKNPKNDQFVGLMGTSMASPLVAGIAAQIWSANPKLTAVQIKTILIETGKPIAELQGKILSGKRVDTEAAMNRVVATRLESSPQP